jgi:diacylglycerol O-acyltransferase
MSEHGEQMSGVDNAWLRMESDTNLMMISGLLVLEKPVKVEALKQLITERLLKFARFRQIVVEKPKGTFWEEDPRFDIENHLHIIALPGQRTLADLQSLAGDLTSTPLNFHRPLWQMHLIENVGDGCALLMRVHHCIADGISLVRVMLSLTDEGAVPVPEEAMGLPKKSQSWLAELVHPVQKLVSETMHLGHELADETREIMQHPSHLLDLAKEGLSIGQELSRLAMMPDEPPTCFRGELSGRKRVAWAEPIVLEDVKAAGKRLGATINDILMTAAAGALRRYLLIIDEIVELDHLNVAVPFNLRPLDQPIKTLGNQFGLVIVPLPVGQRSAMQRLESVCRAMRDLKDSHQAQIYYGLLGILGKGPARMEQTALEVLTRKASLVMTNVPGPKHPLYLAGSRMVQPMVWVPQSGNVGVGLSILSYHDTVQFGVVADKHLVPDPNVIVEAFVQSLNELLVMEVSQQA